MMAAESSFSYSHNKTDALRSVHQAVQGFARDDNFPYFPVIARRDD